MTTKGADMNRDLVEGSWNQFKGGVQVRWSILIGDHLGVISGKRTRLAGERQAAFGALRSKTLRGVMRARTSARSFSSVPALTGSLRSKAPVMSMPTHGNHY